ncbi:hypothetical protein LDA44_10605, partial [Enterococcus faecium]|nr:hypothetical protein [Enterococcus faecium]MCH3301723.1 hypothetical protein [Enterococcus faecium]MCH3304597.1 hypothetical protein [Enterococcus faecium]
SQNVVHSDSDLILHNSSVLIDKEPKLLNECSQKKGCDKNRVTAPFVANKRRSKAYIYGDKSSQVKNIRDCFYLALLIT